MHLLVNGDIKLFERAKSLASRGIGEVTLFVMLPYVMVEWLRRGG
jgi:hypothetical protein